MTDEKENSKKLKKDIKPLLKSVKIYHRHKRLKACYSINDFNNTKFVFNLSSVNLIENDNKNDENILRDVNNSNSKTIKKKKNYNFLYYIFNIAVIAIVLAVQLSKNSVDPKESMASILNINWLYIFAAVGMFAFCMFLEQIRYAVLIHKATGVFRLGLSYKVAALGRYYDTITPLGTGGQPFQVLYTNKYGIKPGEGISIVMGKYIFWQIVYFILVTYFVFKAVFYGSAETTIVNANVGQGVVTTFMWVGYAILACLIIFMLLVSLNRRFGAGFIVGVLKLLSKIRFGKFRVIKDYKKTFTKVMKTVNVWQNTTKKYSKSFWVVFVNIVGSILFFFANYSIPYFIFCAFANEWLPELFIKIVTMSVMVDLTSAFNPIPMGTGTAELSFSVLYTSLFTQYLGLNAGSGAAIWALLIWRIFSCYSFILQGLVVVNYDYFIGNKRLEKYKDYWCLPLKKRLKLKKEIREKVKENND